MGADDNLAVHTRWSDAEDRHDISHHGDFIHDDIEVWTAGSEPTVGFDAYLAVMKATFETMPDFHVVLEDQFATSDRVVCRWRATGTATGKWIEYMGVSLWEFDGGKARRGWVFPDVASLTAQLGPS